MQSTFRHIGGFSVVAEMKGKSDSKETMFFFVFFFYIKQKKHVEKRIRFTTSSVHFVHHTRTEMILSVRITNCLFFFYLVVVIVR